MSTVASTESLTDILLNIQATRYVSAAGIVILLYDHLLTLDNEVRDIWRARWSAPKALFLTIRYLVPCCVIIHIFQLSGMYDNILSDQVVWFSIATAIGVITIAIGNFLVLLRIWILWDRNRHLMLWTLAMFIVTLLGNIVGTTIVIILNLPVLRFSAEMHLCILTGRRYLAILWISPIVFELMVFVTVCWNALQRPRMRHTDFARVLYRDGFTYFITLFSLRVMNLTLAIAAPLSLIFLVVFFVWCSTTVTVTRLILNLRGLSVKRRQQSFWVDY